ncbi:MAG: iron uptake porin, partial [Synechococcaceae cyanobacterium RL_1_2]|nr:iron uptake porin [Synechococcaceae cyanobacterium RL_1_2]
MNKLIWNLVKFAPAVLAAGLVMTGASAVKAESNQEMLDQIQKYSTTGQAVNTMGQVNSISQLRDVAPGDWAFSALRNLVERYDCLDGYPNRTFQGNRALTRYEFAAGLNACMEQMERLITTGSTNVEPTDLSQITRLVDEFEAELATLGTRVDNLEGRLGEVEDNQFSTTTKLKGEAIFTLATGLDGPNVSAFNDNTTLSQRTRLNFESSFTGKDNLHLRLEQGNFGRFGVSNSARLGADENTDGAVELTDLWYSFPVGDAITMHLGASKTEFEDVVTDLYNPYMESSGSGSLTRFLRRNPAVYRIGDNENQTVAANLELSDQFSVDLAYTAAKGNDPAGRNGLFNGDNAALAQLNWNP